MSNFTMPVSRQGHLLQAFAPDPAAVTVGSAGATTSNFALPTGAEVVRIACANDLYFKFGTSGVTATGSDSLMLKGAEVFKVPAGATHIAVIQHTTGGAVTVTAAGD